MTNPTPYLGNPQNTIKILNKYKFVFQKKFGQNFLIDTHVLDKIIQAAEITKEDFVVEIGPGIGTMTQYLASAAKGVAAIEIDKALIPILQDTLKDYSNVTIINQDVLKVDLRKLAEEMNDGRPVKVVANLPYYITTPIIMGLFEHHIPDVYKRQVIQLLRNADLIFKNITVTKLLNLKVTADVSFFLLYRDIIPSLAERRTEEIRQR